MNDSLAHLQLAPSRRRSATAVTLLREQAAALPDHLYVICGPERRTFSQMARTMDQLAGSFACAGVAPGDRVVVLLGNQLETIELFFACARAGAVQIPLNVHLKSEFLRYQIADSGAATVVVEASLLPNLEAVLPDLPLVSRVVVVGEAPVAGAVPPTVELIGFEQFRSSTEALTVPDPEPFDLCSILYTSGTTGMPKGCMVTHGYMVHSGEVFGDQVMGGLRPDDVFFSTMPLFHITGLSSGVLTPLKNGITAVVEPRFSASGYFPRVIETGATVTMGVGAMANALLSLPPAPEDTAHLLRLASYAPMSQTAIKSFSSRFDVEVGVLAYGQTECFPITVDSPEAMAVEPGPGRPVTLTAGHPAPWLQVIVADDRDEEVPRGTPGEVLVRPLAANTMFAGYWRNPEATVEASRNLWHHTGDLAIMDDDGILRFVDRQKDAIRRRGENISSVEVETAILRHPAVADVAVHAVPSPLGEDDVKAWVVPVAGESVTPETLAAHFHAQLPYFAVPRFVEIVETLPRNHTGKLLKNELRARPVSTDQTWDLSAVNSSVAVRVRPSGRGR